MKLLKAITESAVFFGLIVTMTVLIYNLYAMKTGGPTIW